MRRPPRAPSEQVLSPRTLVQVLWTSLLIGGVTLWLFIIERNTGGSYAMAQTTAVTMLAFGQLAYLFNCRFLSTSSLTWRVLVGNRMIWYGVAGLLAFGARVLDLSLLKMLGWPIAALIVSAAAGMGLAFVLQGSGLWLAMLGKAAGVALAFIAILGIAERRTLGEYTRWVQRTWVRMRRQTE